MKYANSLKYIDSFKRRDSSDSISLRRINRLCQDLGQINRGVRFIHVPEGASGHGCAVLLEHILKAAGHKTGRIVCPEDNDSRSAVFVNAEVPAIDDYNKCVAEIKLKVGKNYDSEFLWDEVIFVLSLLICRLEGCEFIILEGTDMLDRVCAPYELTVIPTVYDSENAMKKIVPLCDAVKCGTREVVSGNQKSDVYNYISNVCAPSGQRLFIPVKSQFEIVEQSSRRLVFNYNGREGFSIKTASVIMRDCAITVIEAIMALRREGIRIPMASVKEGLENAGSADSFEIVSYTPTVIVDNSHQKEEISLLYKTFCDVFGDTRLSLCIPAQSDQEIESMIGEIPKEKISRIVAYGHNYDIESYHGINVTVCRTLKDAGRIIASENDFDSMWLCFGGAFGQKIKQEIIKQVNN